MIVPVHSPAVLVVVLIAVLQIRHTKAAGETRSVPCSGGIDDLPGDPGGVAQIRGLGLEFVPIDGFPGAAACSGDLGFLPTTVFALRGRNRYQLVLLGSVGLCSDDDAHAGVLWSNGEVLPEFASPDDLSWLYSRLHSCDALAA